MRLKAALLGNLPEEMKEEFTEASQGVAAGVKEGTKGLQAMLRAQVRSAGLGIGLSKSWKAKFYKNKLIDAAGEVRTRSPRIINAHDRGGTIAAKNGNYLAIPTKHALKKRSGFAGSYKTANRRKGERFQRRYYTPHEWVKAHDQELVLFKSRKGYVLVHEKTYKRRKPKRIVVFVLVKQTVLRKRLDLDRAHRRSQNLLPKLIQKHYRED